jgi:hypothetical protein
MKLIAGIGKAERTSRDLSGDTEENQENFSQDRRSERPRLEFTPNSDEYEEGLLLRVVMNLNYR